MKDVIMITAKLYNYRDTAKRFYGDDFTKKIAPFQKIIKRMMEMENIKTIPALLKISKTEVYESDGMIQLLFIAAAVELMETTK